MRSKKLRQTAKQLLTLSLNARGEIDREVMQKITQYCLEKMPLDQSKHLLYQYYVHLLRFEKSYDAQVEFAGTLPESFQEQISQFLKAYGHHPLTFHCKQTSDLLAGFRISIADDRWEFSINQQLNDLKAVFQSI